MSRKSTYKQVLSIGTAVVLGFALFTGSLDGAPKLLSPQSDEQAAALAEKDRLQRQQEELARYEAVRAAQANQMPPAAPAARTAPIATQSAPRPEESPTAEEIFTVDFRIRATRVQLQGLKQSMINLGIKPERI